MTKQEQLLKLNVNDKTEKKGTLTYLSWAWAWAEFLKVYPDATYEIERNSDGLPYVYSEKTGYMVFSSVNNGELIRKMWLPVMDNRNQTHRNATMTDINKTAMRCLTKNLAMFGLGLYIYAGEDLPEKTEEYSDMSIGPNGEKLEYDQEGYHEYLKFVKDSMVGIPEMEFEEVISKASKDKKKWKPGWSSHFKTTVDKKRAELGFEGK